MRQTKYVMSGGLAFSEKKDMEKLRRLSLKGWHVSDFKFMGYILEKGKSMDYIYSVDYRSINEGEAEEYFDFFSSSGWTHIASEGDVHLFRALPGTKPIYSDRETLVEKHDNSGRAIKWFALTLIFITALAWFGTFISIGPLQMTLTIIAGILSVIAIPTSWTMLAIYNNKWKAEGKKGLTTLIKSLSILFLIFVAFLIFFVVDNSSSSVFILVYMILGAVAFPTAIWIIMSLYQKLSGKNA